MSDPAYLWEEGDIVGGPVAANERAGHVSCLYEACNAKKKIDKVKKDAQQRALTFFHVSLGNVIPAGKHKNLESAQPPTASPAAALCPARSASGPAPVM